MNIVFLVHYFPPLNSTGARRVLAFAKYLHRAGHTIDIISTVKTNKDGILCEDIPSHCSLTEISWVKGKRSVINPSSDKVQSFGTERSKLGNVLVRIKRKLMKYSLREICYPQVHVPSCDGCLFQKTFCRIRKVDILLYDPLVRNNQAIHE